MFGTWPFALLRESAYLTLHIYWLPISIDETQSVDGSFSEVDLAAGKAFEVLAG